MNIKKKIKKYTFLNDYRMYKKAGCHRCSNGQIMNGGGDYCSITYFERCDCSKIKRKKYKQYLEDRDLLMKNMSAFDFKELNCRWYDNYSNIVTGNNAVDRSW